MKPESEQVNRPSIPSSQDFFTQDVEVENDTMRSEAAGFHTYKKCIIDTGITSGYDVIYIIVNSYFLNTSANVFFLFICNTIEYKANTNH